MTSSFFALLCVQEEDGGANGLIKHEIQATAGLQY